MSSKLSYKELEKENELLRAKLESLKKDEKFKSYFDNNQAIMLQIDPVSKSIKNANQAAENFYGYTKKELLSKTMYEVNILPNDEVDKHMSEAIKSKSRFFEFKHKLANGEIRDVEAYSSPVKNEDGTFMVVTLHDITIRNQAVSELKANVERFKTTMNAIDAGVYVADMKSYDLLFTNDYFNKLFGDGVNKKCYSVIQSGKNSVCEFCTNHLLVNEKGVPNEPYVWEFQNTKTKRWFQCRDQAIKWIDGSLVRLEIATDITERKKMEQSLRKNKNDLNELITTKDKFFSIIAHDLKSPLSSVLGFTDLLIRKFDTYDTQKQKEFLKIISDGLDGTYKLLENLLLWSRTQKGSIEFNPEIVNLFLFIDETIDLLGRNVESKSLNIIPKVSQKTSVLADKNMLLSILRNLLSNAIKFTPEGGKISISEKQITLGNKQNFVEITIMDSGVGISKDRLSKLFLISEEISTRGTNNESGTGLGLILCKEFVKMNGGEIRVESEVGKGSKFIFTIPKIH